MRKLLLLSSLALAVAAPTLPTAHAELIYRAGEGWVAGGADAGEAEKSASAQLRKAEAYEKDGDTARALSAYRTLLRQFPDSGAGPHAQFKIAQLQESLGEPERAYDAYGKYLKSYPRGEDFDKAVEAQFTIAKQFLGGARRKVFGIKTFSSMERAQQMFEEILKNAPYSKFAPLAQFNAGLALEKQGKEPEAVTAYQQTVEKYPADAVAGDAQYQIGYLYLQEIRNGSNDRGAREKARDAFEDFIMRFPQSEKVAQAREHLQTLEGKDLKQTLGVAQYYQRTGNPKAAALYYQELVKAAPQSAEAAVAQKALGQLKATFGEEKLRTVPRRAETGAKVEERRKMQTEIETTSRPDFVGPPAPPAPASTEETPEKLQLRTPDASGPSEPALPVP
jgi:outer membrane protein assembly factor BamD